MSSVDDVIGDTDRDSECMPLQSKATPGRVQPGQKVKGGNSGVRVTEPRVRERDAGLVMTDRQTDMFIPGPFPDVLLSCLWLLTFLLTPCLNSNYTATQYLVLIFCL